MASKSYRLRGRTPTAEELVISSGDSCKAVSLITIRAGESLSTEVIATLPIGSVLQVLELGAERRAKIAAGSLIGWISIKTRRNEPLILKRREESISAAENFRTGGNYELKSMVTVRGGEGLESPVVMQLRPGTAVVIQEISASNKRRARISTAEGVDGWVSLVTKNGDLMLGSAAETVNTDVEIVQTMSTSMLKALLEAGRSGDVEQVRKLVEGEPRNSGLHVNLNSSDIRGRTTLIYAAAFGNRGIVDYLLTQPGVDVNALDDTQKSALHHASKRIRNETDEAAQAEIVELLVAAGAYVEARDHNGCTALMFAVANGDDAATRTLLEAQANINVKDYEGHTPLDYAVNFGHEEVAVLLKSHGAEGEDSDRDYNAVPEAKKKKKRAPKKKVDREKSVKKALRNQSMVADGGGGMGADEIAVLDQTPANDEKAARERALEKLKAVMQSTNSPKELETAVKEAADTGVDQSDLQEAENRIKTLKARVKAREALLVAMDDRNVTDLEAAIANAEEQGISQADIDSAKAVLAEEVPKQEARAQLKEAQDRGDANSLNSALEKARSAGLDEAELASFAELLRGAESKEKAEAALQKAIEERNVASLRFAIQQAREAGVDNARIELGVEVLKEEEPKQRARDQLASALERVSIEDLKSAIAAAKEVELLPEEYAEAETVLQHEEHKQELLAEVLKAVESSLGVDTNKLEELKEAKTGLSDKINVAKEAGVAETDLLEAEQRRRKLHNAIQDLIGSVRVFCRVRPLSNKEEKQGDTNICKQIDLMTLGVQQSVGMINFSFDAVFTPGSQEEVFEDCKDLVQSAVDGYNVTMFAYGQTGAGKTFTMYGAPGQEGTAPRTIDEIYRIIDRDKERFNFTVMASMVELYRNDLVDLLTKSDPNATLNPKKLNIRTEKSGMVMIEHLVEEECRDAEELMKCLRRGNEMRTVAATAMNSESSRSHLILIIKIVSVNKETHDQLRGKILMCDLAGSERLKKSEVTGDTQKEAIEINKSLTVLGDVIEALTKKQKSVPYRNHKLTQVMQDSLGGTSKTLMFVNCSPASSNMDETLMSLKYATRAKNITNTAKRTTLSIRESIVSNSSQAALPVS